MTLIELTPVSPQASEALTALPVVIIGAGPVGLAAAAHLVERGIPFRVLESGDTVGAAMASWGHVRLFSPWEFVTDKAAERLLVASGWSAPGPKTIPFGRDIVADYLVPLAQLPEIAPQLTLRAEVVSVSRRGMDRTRSQGRADRPFQVVVRDASGATIEVDARAVLDASGTWSNPNPILSDGVNRPLPAGFVRALHSPLPDVLGRDRAAFAGRRVAVVGSGHSAANTLLSLAELAESEPGTSITWLMRRRYPRAGLGSGSDQLPERGALGRRAHALVRAGRIQLIEGFEVVGASARNGELALIGSTAGGVREVAVDAVVASTGFRPDLRALREIRLGLDEVVEAPRLLAPLIDPNAHSCGTVPPHGVVELTHPEKDFYLVGMKSYGRAPTFLLATGYEQVRSVVAELAGDRASARRVQLVLPATGACSTDSGAEADDTGGSGCC